MRMEHFASIDPAEAERRKGLVRTGSMCAKVYREWQGKREHLQACAEVLRRQVEIPSSSQFRLFDPHPVALPRAFDKYELLDLIGHGSFGSVYSCINALNAQVGAIKIIQADKIHDEETLHRFIREIRALKAVENPYVIRLHEHNLSDERRFPAFVMDLADTNLTGFLNARRGTAVSRPALHLSDANQIVISMVEALHALHSRSPRIIHRDLNPNNILLLPDGRWVLADFGLAKFLDAVDFTTSFQTKTRQGTWGTGFYGAPEQYHDFKRTDERTDIYALGVLVWELYTSVGPPMRDNNLGLPDPLGDVSQTSPFLR